MDITKLLPTVTVPSAFEKIEKTYHAFSPALGLNSVVANTYNIAPSTGIYGTSSLLEKVVGVSPASNFAYLPNLTNTVENSITTNMANTVSSFVNTSDIGTIAFPFTDIATGITTNTFADDCSLHISKCGPLESLTKISNVFTAPITNAVFNVLGENSTFGIGKSGTFENLYKASEVITAPLKSLSVGDSVLNSVVNNNWAANVDPLGTSVFNCFEGSAALKIDPDIYTIAASNVVHNALTSIGTMLNPISNGIADNVVKIDAIKGVGQTWSKFENIGFPSVINEPVEFPDILSNGVNATTLSSLIYNENKVGVRTYVHNDTRVSVERKESHITIVNIYCDSFNGDVISDLTSIGDGTKLIVNVNKNE